MIIPVDVIMSPVPFGGLSGKDTIFDKAYRGTRESPVPFGGLSGKDSIGWLPRMSGETGSPVPFGGLSGKDITTH